MNKELLPKLIPVAIIIIGTGVLSFIFYRQYRSGSLGKSLASLQVESLTEEQLEVFVNEEPQGPTPFIADDLKPGRLALRLVGSAGTYTTTLDLYANTRTVITRKVSSSDLLSAGEVIWLEPGLGQDQYGLSVVGSPEGAIVLVDGREVGEVPYVSTRMSPDEHTLSVSAPGYETRGLRISLSSGYQLNVAVQLAARPVPQETLPAIKSAETSLWSVLDLSLGEASLLVGTPGEWVKGVVAWYQEHPGDLSAPFDYYFDYNGSFYNSSGSPLALEELSTAIGERTDISTPLVLGYLGNSSDSSLTDSAAQALSTLAGGVSLGKQVRILPTGTGWLRVRSEPGLSGSEVTKVSVGEEFAVLEESGTWVKIQVDEETVGWVSGTYVEVVEPSPESDGEPVFSS